MAEIERQKAGGLKWNYLTQSLYEDCLSRQTALAHHHIRRDHGSVAAKLILSILEVAFWGHLRKSDGPPLRTLPQKRPAQLQCRYINPDLCSATCFLMP